MCGIAGIVSAELLDDSASDRVVRMRDVLQHRGPDEAGLHVDSFAALAHRRLSIVDLSTGQQARRKQESRLSREDPVSCQAALQSRKK